MLGMCQKFLKFPNFPLVSYQSTAFPFKINHFHWICVGGVPFFCHILRIFLSKADLWCWFHPIAPAELMTHKSTCQPSIPPIVLVQNVSKLAVEGDPVETYWVVKLDHFPLGSRWKVQEYLKPSPSSTFSGDKIDLKKKHIRLSYFERFRRILNNCHYITNPNFMHL